MKKEMKREVEDALEILNGLISNYNDFFINESKPIPDEIKDTYLNVAKVFMNDLKEEDLKKYQKSSSYEDLVSKYNTLKSNVSEAESRIKEHNDKVIMLDKENKIKDGRMFKMDFDPRIIGNKILPDGEKKTGIGEFIRKTSLDEFPQFYNVLKGDMSLVGTRPPLESEVNLYELHHHARLAVKPGITGMWQVSGRSNITDFEEVVKLDKEYINNWSIGLDIKIIFKTILVVFKKEGSM